MTLGRRDFLQRLSAALAILGVTDSWLAGSVRTYQQAFADASQCWALLVGINDYPAKTWQASPTVDKSPFLQGALTDLELQRELLINRFGVAPQNIVTLTDAAATVSQILAAVQGHLVEQAKPGDTVVFHFSGLGSQAYLTGRSGRNLLPSLLGVNSHLPDDEAPIIQDLFVENLAQQLATLHDVNVLTVLDASSAAFPSLQRGNFRVRSRSTVPTGLWSEPVDPHLTKPTQSWPQLTAAWPGVLLHPQMVGAISLEGNWSGFSAGLFTYALTQQIWMSVPAQRQQWFIHRIDRKLSAWTGADQTSQIFDKSLTKRSDISQWSGRLPQPAADGVVDTVDTVNRNAIVWLGGLPSILLPYCELGLRLQPLATLPNSASAPDGTLVVKALDGLRGKVTSSNLQGLRVGTPVIEVERRVPKDMTLTIALDPALERIERVDATSALSNLVDLSTTAPGERVADCLFGKSRSLLRNYGAATPAETTDDAAIAAPAESAPPGYGLFTPDGSLIVGTTAEEEEAVKTAVTRLTGTLRSLLAVKMLRLTLNPVSSQLAVRLVLETQAPNSQLLLLEETLRSRQLSDADLSPSGRIALGALNRIRPEQYQIRLANAGPETIYYLLISVVEKSRLLVYCPPLKMSEANDQSSRAIASESVLPGNTAIQYPKRSDTSFALQPLQTTEVFAITCREPFLKTWKAIRTPEFGYQGDRWSTISEPLLVTQALLQDLHQAGTNLSDTAAPPPDNVLALRAAAWAALSL